MSELVQHPIVKMAIAGFVTAAAIDFAAFRQWKSFEDARQYDWSLAAWRWVQGLIYGALTGLGFGAVA